MHHLLPISRANALGIQLDRIACSIGPHNGAEKPQRSIGFSASVAAAATQVLRVLQTNQTTITLEYYDKFSAITPALPILTPTVEERREGKAFILY